LSVENVTVTRDRHEILRFVSHDFAAGMLVAIMGRNGSGKTTLLRTIVGLNTPQSGRVLLNGADLAPIPIEQRAQQIGYVPQDPRSLLFHETVEQELRWTLQQHSKTLVGETSDRERIQQTLARLKIEHLAQAHPRDLSGGEQQRVALATILVADPAVLLLDEPTRGLDYQHKAVLISLLADLRREGRAIVLVTHDVELVAACADQIVLMGNGEVVVAGPPHELLNSSLIFSSQIGKLFRHQPWLTVDEALAGLQAAK
jgi:energy-coupling factor transport system ATP-binding protein